MGKGKFFQRFSLPELRRQGFSLRRNRRAHDDPPLVRKGRFLDPKVDRAQLSHVRPGQLTPLTDWYGCAVQVGP